MTRSTSPILQAAKDHFASLAGGEINVPEWSDAKIRWSPMTLADRRKIYAPSGNGDLADGSTIFIRALILKARDENGEPIFTKMDENHLDHGVDPTVVARIATAILAGGSETSTESDGLDLAKNG